MNKHPLFRTCIFALSMLSGTAYAQTSSDPQSYLLPSPTAMAFQKYGDYPVDYSTGVPSIAIPLYTIQLKGYSFPISASFHASGRSTAQNFSPLGMNWALMANGLISREVRGKVDGTVNNHLEKAPSDLTPQSQHYTDLWSLDPDNPTGNQDNEYDIYSISLNGLSAKFIIRDNAQVVFLTYCPYTVTYNGSTLFTVTDDKGIVYVFGNDGAGNGNVETDNSGVFHSSGWSIATITLPAGNQIKFKYDNQLIQSATYMGNRIVSDLLEIKDCAYINTSGGYSNLFNNYFPTNNAPKPTTPVSQEDFSISYLTEIDFDNGVISFTYNSNSVNFLLDRIKVTSAQNVVVQNIQFSYFALPGTNLVLKNNNSATIQNIFFQDAGNTTINKYGFDYYTGVTGGDLQTFIRTKDWWGYCNNAASTKMIPISTVTFTSGGGTSNYNTGGDPTCKNPDFNSKLPGMIKTIHYPTGGTSEFTYEANKYNNSLGTAVDGPGIRIKKIVSDDGFGNQTGKTYEYGPGYIMREPKTDDYYTKKSNVLLWANNGSTGTTFQTDLIGSYRYVLYSSEPLPEAQVASRYPVYYQLVTEYDYAADNSKNGKTVYNYGFPSTYSSYNTITAGPGANSFTFGDATWYPMVFSFSEWSQPQIQSKLIQKYNGASDTYSTISYTSYNYVQLNTVNVPQTCLYKYIGFPTEINPNPTPPFSYQQTVITGAGFGWQVYSLLDKTIRSAILKPQSETTVTYDDKGTQLTNTVNYYYDNLTHLNPTRIQRTTSDAKTITQYTNYPNDYPAGTGFIDNLVTRHILNAPVEQVTVQNVGAVNKILSGMLTSYTGSAVYQVSKVETAAPIDLASFKFSNRSMGTLPPAGSATAFTADNIYKLKLTYNSYDSRNNPLTITPADNIPISYVWGYNQSYPIANVKNAVNTNIFYTGFEETEGNSTAGDCKAGTLSHTGGYSRTLTGLQNGSYILSYWQKSGAVWTLQNSTVSVASGSYSMSLSGQVDEVRFYPAAAQMTSYTYTPLLGMSSQSNLNHLPSYYEYDGFGRLKDVRDQDGNIIKTIDYHFKGQ